VGRRTDVAELMETPIHFHVTPVRSEDGSLVLRLRGELDLATVPALVRAVAQAVELGPASIVLDLSTLEFLDARGVSGLIDAGRLAGAAHRPMSVRNAHGLPEAVLRLTGADAELRDLASEADLTSEAEVTSEPEVVVNYGGGRHGDNHP
jgi:anti-sigma B factor antagonist